MHPQSQTIGKPKELKVFGCMKTKGPKQDSQNWLALPLPYMLANSLTVQMLQNVHFTIAGVHYFHAVIVKTKHSLYIIRIDQIYSIVHYFPF